MKRDRSYVIKEALDDYLRWMEYERQRIATAREAIARGDANELVEVLDDLDREFFAADLTEREPEGARQTQRRG
jgi:predicted transcriptional regulator